MGIPSIFKKLFKKRIKIQQILNKEKRGDSQYLQNQVFVKNTKNSPFFDTFLSKFLSSFLWGFPVSSKNFYQKLHIFSSKNRSIFFKTSYRKTSFLHFFENQKICKFFSYFLTILRKNFVQPFILPINEAPSILFFRISAKNYVKKIFFHKI